jgi:hypothetical protein
VNMRDYIEQLQRSGFVPRLNRISPPSSLLDWLVNSQVIAKKPAHTVRGARYSVIKGATNNLLSTHLLTVPIG